MKTVAPTVCAILGLPSPTAATEAPIAPIAEDLAGAQRVAVLAPDALGIVAWGLWQGDMPFLQSLHRERSILLESTMPSITPINFACMLTGAEVEVHGMHKREMDFQCETVYDAVRAGGGKSAGVGHRGYSGELLLARYADIPGVMAPGACMPVTDTIIEIFEADAPQFLIAQYGHTDSVFHKIGPSDPECAPMLRECDQALEKAIGYLRERGVGIIILSDHGQHDVPDAKEGENRGKHGADRPEDRLVPCTWVAP